MREARVERRKRQRGPTATKITERELTERDLRPIIFPERTYSQKQKLRVLSFLEHHRIALESQPGEYRRPTQVEASALFQIPQRTISDWVRGRESIEVGGVGCTVKRREESGYSTRILWPELEAQLYREFLKRREAGRTVRQGWFRVQSQFLFRSLYPNVSPTIFRFSPGWFRGFLARNKISLRMSQI